MQSPFTLDHYVELDDECAARLLLLQAVVAHALSDVDSGELAPVFEQYSSLLPGLAAAGLDAADFLTSSAAGTPRWRQLLAEADWTCTDELHRSLTLMEICTTSVFVESELLEHPPAVRRLDTVLDILDAPTSCFALRAVYVEAAEVLLGSKGPDWRPGALSGAKKASELLYWFHPVLGLTATAALNWVNVDEAAATGTTAAPVLARLLAVCGAAEEQLGQELADRAIPVLLKEMDKAARRVQSLRGSPTASSAATQGKLAELQGLQAAQSNALRYLRGAAGLDATERGLDVPLLTGQRLTDAREVLKAFSVNVQVDDAVQPAGTSRVILAERNWVVADQEVHKGADGHTVKLLVRKASE